MVRSEGNMSLKNPVTPPGIDPGTVRLVARRLNHYATTGPNCVITFPYINYKGVHNRDPLLRQVFKTTEHLGDETENV